ncbi:hypothetical protein AFR_10050 [Actinoplanes friuliensis DSM 7358]|uniref:Clumping factor A n=1 Tax=Actinoplanes friuliensis DSM 7358 TaxID=1246995 RepID=U5VTV0_9ACTN|nr:hypothetical protein [Actinoplanes friuliensis]AGZ40299.1 hypothetical protein AFR_10050 [Actinoplanes friuliensis DSM 7358]
MIVASLLLILVAVTLLVIGLAGGSSSLLISSIVASLLAAVALVIGARQASAARRAGTTSDDAAADPALSRPATVRMADLDDLPEPQSGHETARREEDDDLATPDVTQRVHPDADLHDEAAAGRASSVQPAGAASRDDDPAYDQASTVIGAARADAAEDNAWRREPAPPTSASSSSSVSSSDEAAAAAPAGSTSEPDFNRLQDTGPSEEFDEPDPEDPDDEPLPQAVRPADAVRVARLDAEVLVVDGRPRYHLADCPHLVGRLTEGLPVAEAVELGFSPCGLCRPVDRLVAAAARS